MIIAQLLLSPGKKLCATTKYLYDIAKCDISYRSLDYESVTAPNNNVTTII